jgi:hypothetical protein
MIKEEPLDQMMARGAGLDVHKRTIVACGRGPGRGPERGPHVQTFGTTAADRLLRRDWLAAHAVTHGAMESTGVFWKPGYYALEDGVTVRRINAAHIKQVPGRKPDVQDSVWIAQLLEHGLVRGSFVPPAPLRARRDLTRYRDDPGAGAGGASDSPGAGGGGHPARRRREQAPAFLLGERLAQLDSLDEAIARVSEEIAAARRPFAAAGARRETIPGMRRRAAEVRVAELGVDLRAFPTAGHAASWAGRGPGHPESAGRAPSGKPRKGTRWLKRTLTQTARAAIQSKQPNALGARYRRLRRHTGHRKAVVAVSHAPLVVADHLLATERNYIDLGPDSCDRHAAERARRRAIRTLERQGYRVTLEQAA